MGAMEQGAGSPEAVALGLYLRKKVIFGIIALGALLMWLGMLIEIISRGNRDLFNAGLLFILTGAFIAFAMAVAGALGSKRTTDSQNFGLLILSGALVIAIAILAANQI